MASSLLHVWIGTGNLGNAAPDEASWKEWVPADGYFSAADEEDGRYHCVTTLPTNENDRLQQFDIMVFGMQESTFDPPSKVENGSGKRVSSAAANASEGGLPPIPDSTEHGEEEEEGTEAGEGEEHSSSNLAPLKKNVTALLSPTAKAVGHTVQTIGKTTTKTVRKIHSKTGHTIQSWQNLSTNRDHCQSPSQGGSVLSKLTRSSGDGETPTEAWRGGTAVLHALLSERCPSYDRIVSFQRGEMRLAILVRRGAVETPEVVSVAAQNTGRAGLANKGGIVAELRVGSGTRLSFGTAHLEAHEGAAKYQIRVTTLADIFSGTTLQSHDVSLTSHYSFFMGDLNFRTELPDKSLTDEEHKRIVRDMVARQDWPALNAIDELQRALQNKECLVGYRTLPCLFPPTFKVERKKGYEYIDKRRPSYTDRILWKANHGMEELQPLFYEPVGDFASSDHKPVRAAFSIPLNAPYALRPKLGKHRSIPRLSMLLHKRKHDMSSSLQLGHKERFHLFVSEMSCQIYVKNKSSRALVQTVPHPYICIMSDPPEALQAKVERGLRLRYTNLVRALQSRRRSRTLHSTCFLDPQGFPRSSILRPNKWSTPCCGTHAWSHEEVHAEIQTHRADGSSLDLTGAMLRLTVMDHLFRTSATGERNVVLGTVVVHLVPLLQACRRPAGNGSSSRAMDPSEGSATAAEDPIVTVRIDAPLLKNGVETGHLKCQLEVWWMDDRTAKVFAGLGMASSGRRQQRRTNNRLQNSNAASSDLRLRWSEEKTRATEAKPKQRLQRA